jgi:hypothetical protein
VTTERFCDWIEDWSNIEHVVISEAVKEFNYLTLDLFLKELDGAVLISEEKPLPEEYNPTEEKR